MARGGRRESPDGKVLNGRTKGSKNRKTLEREERERQELAARTATEQLPEAKKLPSKRAKQVLRDFMEVFAGMAATFQPLPPSQAQQQAALKPYADERKFLTYAKLARDTAEMLAPFEDPKYKAIIVASTPDAATPPTQPGIGAKVIDMNADPQRAADVYRRLIAAAVEAA